MASPSAAQSRRLENRGPVVLAVTAAMISCATLFVFFRLVSRIGIVKRVMLDDYFIVVAWLISFALSFSICYATHFGLGKHEEDIPERDRDPLNKLDYTFTALYNPALMATKTSILTFYLSLAKEQKTFRWTTWATLVVVNTVGFALTLVNIFQCRPLGALFEAPRPPSARCTDIVTLYLSSAPVNIVTDIVILLLPMPILKRMRLPRKQKIILYVTFGFGVFVAVVDVVRISYLQQASVTRVMDVLQGQQADSQTTNEMLSDFSWYVSLSFMWSAVEVNVGIMVACVPALKPLVSRFLPNALRDRVATGTHSKRESKGTLDTEDVLRDHRMPSGQLPREASGQGSDAPHAEVRMPDFLTTPDMTELPANIRRRDTVMTLATGNPDQPSPTFFDFVNMNEGTSIVDMTNKESLRPIAQVTLLFFLWGFAYGLLGALNSQVQLIARETPSQSTGVQAAYWVGYLVAPLTFGRLILKRWGFKACYMIGLTIYGTGTLIFWPAAVLTSFPAFLVTNFIVGLGLSTLEVAANPFIALCGPPEYAEMRLNFSQGIQAVGTVCANVLAKKALFKNVLDAPSLIDVQWTYLAISLFTFVLTFVYYIIKLPEVTDEELEHGAQRSKCGQISELRASRIFWATVGLAALSQFCYVGGQQSVATSLDAYIARVSPGADTTSYEAVGQTLFAASRFVSASAGFFVTPRHQLVFWYGGLVVFSALSMNFSGLTSGALVMCVFFFEGPVFSLIYASILRSLGRYTKDGAVLMTAATSGGALFPGVLFAVSRRRNVQYAYCVVVAAFAFGATFPVLVSTVPRAKLQLDPATRPKALQRARAFSYMTKRRRKADASVESEARSSIST